MGLLCHSTLLFVSSNSGDDKQMNEHNRTADNHIIRRATRISRQDWGKNRHDTDVCRTAANHGGFFEIFNIQIV